MKNRCAVSTGFLHKKFLIVIIVIFIIIIIFILTFLFLFKIFKHKQFFRGPSSFCSCRGRWRLRSLLLCAVLMRLRPRGIPAPLPLAAVECWTPGRLQELLLQLVKRRFLVHAHWGVEGSLAQAAAKLS